MAQGDEGRTEDWFNDIQGIIQGFALWGLSQLGTWLSHVDAVILRSIQDGYCISRHGHQRDERSWGFASTNAWKAFFDKLYAGSDSSKLISLWSTAKQTATNYGEGYTYAHETSPNSYEQFFLDTGNISRQTASAGGLGDNVESLMVDIGIEWEVLLSAGNRAGDFFNEPRSLIGGYAPVYWHSQTIWSTPNWWSGPSIFPNWEYSHFARN